MKRIVYIIVALVLQSAVLYSATRRMITPEEVGGIERNKGYTRGYGQGEYDGMGQGMLDRVRNIPEAQQQRIITESKLNEAVEHYTKSSNSELFKQGYKHGYGSGWLVGYEEGYAYDPTPLIEAVPVEEVREIMVKE